MDTSEQVVLYIEEQAVIQVFIRALAQDLDPEKSSTLRNVSALIHMCFIVTYLRNMLTLYVVVH